MKKADEKRLRAIIAEEVKANARGTVISGVKCVGVQFDAKAVDAIETVAAGLHENARALGTLAEVFRASHVELDSFIKIGGGE